MWSVAHHPVLDRGAMWHVSLNLDTCNAVERVVYFVTLGKLEWLTIDLAVAEDCSALHPHPCIPHSASRQMSVLLLS